MIASQMGYVLSAASLLDNAIAGIPTRYYPLYIDKVRKGEVYYANISTRFRKKIPNSVTCGAYMRVGRTKVYGSHLFADLQLSIADSGATSTITFAMSLQE